MAMVLSTMQPEPTWDETANAETVAAIQSVAESLTVHVWGGDWCGDCRRELPALAAALQAADISESQINVHEVDQQKSGPLVEAYDVERLPTVVFELDGEEKARFEEQADRPAPIALADQL